MEVTLEAEQKSKRRHDPERRERIIGACLDVIALHGVSGTTHRRVAEAADVPLGSMTYHFDSLDDLLVEAFTRFGRTISDFYREVLGAAATREEACNAVVELVCGGTWTNDRNMTLLFELYAFGARKPEMRRIMSDWMARSRDALELHFPPHTARALDAIIEGATIHNLASSQHLPPDEVRAIVIAIARQA